MKSRFSVRELRNLFAQRLRALATGRITNDDFEEEMLAIFTHDFTLEQVFWAGAWTLYSDNRCYKLTGSDALSRTEKRAVARWILFLKSGLPYSWPRYPQISGWLAWLLFLLPIPLAYYWHVWPLTIAGLFLICLIDRIFVRFKSRAFRKSGEIEFWPFISKADYNQALRHPPYLAGRSSYPV
jgi:hypothetical protein